jgi:hypothetical protein
MRRDKTTCDELRPIAQGGPLPLNKRALQIPIGIVIGNSTAEA